MNLLVEVGSSRRVVETDERSGRGRHGAWWMRFLVICCLKVIFVTTEAGQDHEFDNNPADDQIGHLKPLGSHMSPLGNLTVVTKTPNPESFFRRHVNMRSPLVLWKIATAVPAFQLWKDLYLSDKYGDLEVSVEVTKKENRSSPSRKMMMNDFIDQYRSKDLYMVHHITGDMRSEISLPRPLQCGGFQRMLVDAVLWLSSGGTKSVLHSDEFNNFNCLLEGRKEIILIDQVYKSQIEADGFIQQGHYSLVDVDMVDIHKFPGLSQVPFYAVTLHPGDCIFMPARWYHQVRSFGSRNMAFNIWFAQLLYFDASDCDEVGSLPEFRSLKDYSFTGHTEQMRASILEEFVSLEVISLEDCRRQWSQKLKDSGSIDKLFRLIDTNVDQNLSWQELYAFDVLEVARKFPLLFAPTSAEGNEVAEDQTGSDHSVMMNVPHEEL